MERFLINNLEKYSKILLEMYDLLKGLASVKFTNSYLKKEQVCEIQLEPTLNTFPSLIYIFKLAFYLFGDVELVLPEAKQKPFSINTEKPPKDPNCSSF